MLPRRYGILAIVTLGLSQPLTAQMLPKSVPERLGYPVNARLLIIHADDFGMDHSVNRAVIEAFQGGWITSASILVPCPWFPEVARWAATHPDADLGIHLALTSEWTDLRWGPVSGVSRVPSLVDERGYLPLDTPEVVQNAKMAEVAFELRAQADRALKSGIRISHFDMHMATLVATSDLFNAYRKMGEMFHVPILLERSGTHAPPDSALGPRLDTLIDRVISMEPGVPAKDWLDWYKKQLAPLPPGVYQLTVHLAYDDEEMRGATWDHSDWGAAWRQRDFDMVKSAEFRQFLKEQGFVLVTWKRLAQAVERSAGAPQPR
jgi:chitin disaccharide deacetylase